jgi:hypothetical protein
MRKNILILECSVVFSQVIAFAGIEPRFAAARSVFPERSIGDANATLARVQGETSTTEVAGPMSRRQIRERRESSLPSPGPDWPFDSRSRGAIALGSTLQTNSCGAATSASRVLREAPCWTRKRVCKPAVTSPGLTAGPPHAEVLDPGSFFASLVLRRVRARPSAASRPEQPDRYSNHPKLRPVSPAALEVTSAGASSPAPVVAALETQLAELAWRRLGGHTGERP